METPRQFGVYFYTWYCPQKWQEHDKQFTPLIGEYDSRDPKVIEWQVDQLARAGVDYVIFEYVPHQDWVSKVSEEAITKKIALLKAKNIKVSFLLDAFVLPENGDLLLEFDLLVKYIHHIGLDHVQTGPKGLPVLFTFGAFTEPMKKVKEKYRNAFEIYSVLWVPTWKKYDVIAHPLLKLNVFQQNLGDLVQAGENIAEKLEPHGYIPFWQETADIVELNKFATVMPGYDDLPLKRNPQLAPVVPRDNGITYTEQFQKAANSGAEHIIIYGWNEYFEATNIEPTVEYGHFYVDLTKKLIDQVKHT